MPLTAERRYKHGRVVELLGAHDLDAVLFTRRCNFSWYTCGARNYVATADDVGVSTLVVARDGATVVTNNIEQTRLRDEDLAGTDIDVFGYSYADPADRAKVIAKAVGRRRVAADVPVEGIDAAPLPDEFNRLRWTLTRGEIERYRALATDTVAAVETVCRTANPGQTEDELAAMTAMELRCRGCLPWVLLVGADSRLEKHRHPLPTGKHVEQYVMVASCGERGGLIAACSRLVSFEKVHGRLAEKHGAVVTVDAALIGATRPGAALGDIYAEAQRAYATVGFHDQWMFHHQGGSIGYLPREVKAMPGSKITALASQAFAWNPSVAGTKSEDTILCLETGPELLAAPTDWPMVSAEWKGFAIDRPAILER
ncbi:MAG TPA: M24 family metallopeptidase [Phycisphaerae bacterium]|nr:M24 family metallopeptidase [Phycisphaerae bacterium]